MERPNVALQAWILSSAYTDLDLCDGPVLLPALIARKPSVFHAFCM